MDRKFCKWVILTFAETEKKEKKEKKKKKKKKKQKSDEKFSTVHSGNGPSGYEKEKKTKKNSGEKLFVIETELFIISCLFFESSSTT